MPEWHPKVAPIVYTRTTKSVRGEWQPIAKFVVHITDYGSSVDCGFEPPSAISGLDSQEAITEFDGRDQSGLTLITTSVIIRI